MKSIFRVPLLALFVVGLFTIADAQQVKRTEFDVTSYTIDAQLARIAEILLPADETPGVAGEVAG